MVMMRARCSLLAAAALCAALCVAPAPALAADDFKACRGDKSDINALLGVPRVNLGMGAVSNNLGDYESPVQACPADPTSICNADWVDELSADLVLDQAYGSDNPESWINYAQGLVMYSFIGAAFAIIAVVGGVVALLIRCCCCRGVGVQVSEDPDKGGPSYPMWQTVGTYFCLGFFIIIVFTFTMLAHVRGNQGFTDAQLALVDAPDGLVELAQGVSDPAVDLITDLVGNTTLNLIERVNSTFFAAGSLALLHDSVQCAREMYVELTNTSLVDGFLAVLTSVEVALVSAPSAANVSATLAPVRVNIDALLLAVDGADAQLVAFQGAMTAVNLTDIEVQVDGLDAELAALRLELQAMSAELTTYVAIQDDITALDATIDPLLAPDYIPGDVMAYKGAFSTFSANLAALPDEADIAADLTALNGTLDAVDVRLAALEATMTAAQSSLSAVDLVAVDASLTNVVNAIDAFNLTALRAEVGSLLAFAADLPSVTPVTDKINELLALRDKIPCVFNASTVPQSISDNLVELPAEVLNLTAQFDVLNDTISQAADELQVVLDDIDSFSGSFNGTLQAAADDFDAQIDTAETTLADARALVVDLQTELSGVNPDILNLTDALASLAGVRLEIADPALRPTTAMLTAIDDAGTARGTLSSQLSLLAGSGFSGRVDNVAALLTPGDWTCPVSPDVCWTRSTGTFDACGGVGELCDYPFEGWTALRGVIVAFNASIDAVSPSLRGEVLPQLAAADASAAAANLGCCNDLSDLTALQTDLDSAATDVASARSSIQGINDTLATLETDFSTLLDVNATFGTTFDSIRLQLQAFNTTTLLGDLDQLEQVFDKEASIYGLLTTGLVTTFTELRVQRLRDIANGPTGLEGMFLHVATQLDAAIAQVEPAQATLVSRLADVNEYVRILDAVRDNDGSTRAVGSIYYLQRALAAASNSSGGDFPEASVFDAYDKPTALGFIQDGRIIEYPGAVKCLTDECLRNSVEFYNTDEIRNVAPEEFNNIVSLPMSRETATGLPFMIPGFVLLIAVSVFFIPQCGYVLACCSVCIMPWIFLVVGGLIFPFLLLTADSCASAEAVGVTALRELTPVLCEQINGTMSPAGFCSVFVDAPPLGNKTIEIDAPEILKSLLLDCSGSSAANLAPGAAEQEPVKALIQSFGLEASSIVASQMTELLDTILPDFGVVLRPLLRADVEASSPELVGDVQQLADSLDGALGCAKVNDAYLGFKDTFCCDFASAFYWSFAGWYLIAFSMLLCGLPVGCFAATRLRNIKRSRAQLREFYERTGTTIAASGVGRAATAAYARVVTPRGEGSTHGGGAHVATAEVVGVEPRAGGGSRREQLGRMGAAVGTSFRRGKERAKEGARGVQQRMRDLAQRRERVAENERRIADMEAGDDDRIVAAHAKLQDPEAL